ncbi:hypothetical protein [Actinoplanes derwentensis]|uniref:Uncharacterized protein n=1 Tax=Actinoplanes derwentensis TaxID=113562 RepID=A0A1H1RPD6_9ACTN|nr:hypothetical protein [Actinoplanes derwentensis]GID84483.1 hypothetical protein Ade03nite_34070 [Actinoplanes derwentensis]SDS37513.1 hypothetical protein SAMN04489716_0648 [Actinoplanes derwentensis]
MTASSHEVSYSAEAAQVPQLMELFASAWWAAHRTETEIRGILAGSDVVVTDGTIPVFALRWEKTRARSTASAARSAQLHFDKGVPVSAGSWQASALTSATWTGVNLVGRPGRGR